MHKLSHKLRLQILSLYIAEVVQVQDEYAARHPDELTIHVGDIIRKCRPMYKGWLEGELNGTTGIFPGNYVVEPGMYVQIPVHISVSIYKQW